MPRQAGANSAVLSDAVGQEQQRPSVIATLCVKEPDADLQDALIETADGPGLGMPLVLDRLMALVVFTLIEEPNSFQQPGRGFGLARRAALLENVSQHRIEKAARRLDPRQVITDDPLEHQRAGIDPGYRAQQGRPGKISLAGRQMPGLRFVIAAIAEMDVEDAIFHRGQQHKRVGIRLRGLERVEGETDPLGAGVELLHARREGEDIAHRSQRTPRDILDGEAQPGRGAGAPTLSGRVDEMRVGRRRPHLGPLRTMPDDDLCPQLDRTVDRAREQGAALARPPRIWREQGMKLLPEMDRMHARPGVAAARRKLPDEAGCRTRPVSGA